MLGVSALSTSPISSQVQSGFIATIALAPAISVFAFTGAEKFSGSIALAPAISVFAFTGAEKFSGALALAPGAPTIAVAAISYIMAAAVALSQPISVIAITDKEDFIIASLNLTQPGSSTIVISGFHNSLTLWQAAVTPNQVSRSHQPVLQDLRQTDATLKQIRISSPALQQLRKTQPLLGE